MSHSDTGALLEYILVYLSFRRLVLLFLLLFYLSFVEDKLS